MTDAEKICAGVDERFREQAVTLAEAVLTLQEKIQQQTEMYKSIPLAQTVTSGQGEQVLRTNPATVEFRSTVRDYAASLKSLSDILGKGKHSAEVTGLDDIRAMFKVAK